MSDQHIANFIEITGATLEQAQQFTLATDNLQDALTLFYSTDDAPFAAPTTIRDPIAPINDTLASAGHGFNHWVGLPHFDTNSSRNPFQDNDEDDDPDPTTDKNNLLARLFRVPDEIMFPSANIDLAKQRAVDESKSVLVSVFQDGEFSCMEMLRDLWNNKDVKDFIISNFLFCYVFKLF